MAKFAIILQAQPNDPGRAVHSLLFAQDLKEADHQVRLIFDGAGTTWIGEFEKPDHKYTELYNDVKGQGLIAGACEYCAEAFKTKDAIVRSGIPLINEYDGHPSISKLIGEGYTLITL